jgi:hypothetical protein
MAVPCPFSGYGFRPPRRAAVGRSGWRHNTAGGTQRRSTTTLPWTTRTTPRRLALGPAPQSSAGRHCNLTTPVDEAVSACSTTLSRPVPRVLGTSQPSLDRSIRRGFGPQARGLQREAFRVGRHRQAPVAAADILVDDDHDFIQKAVGGWIRGAASRTRDDCRHSSTITPR